MSRLYKRADSPNWYYTDSSGSYRIMKSTGTANRQIAELIRARWDEERILRKHGIKTKKMTCEELYEEYMRLIESRKSSSWAKRIRIALKQFCRIHGDHQGIALAA